MEVVEQGPSLRDVVLADKSSAPSVFEIYDRCIEQVRRFRELHLKYAAQYIHNQAQRGAGNPTDVGTGGTPFMRYLKKHEDETAEHRVKS
jgi:indoleamine 2,3-dioxygenase